MSSIAIAKSLDVLSHLFAEAEKIIEGMKPEEVISVYDFSQTLHKILPPGDLDFFCVHALMKFYLRGHPDMWSFTHSGTGDYKKL